MELDLIMSRGSCYDNEEGYYPNSGDEQGFTSEPSSDEESSQEFPAIIYTAQELVPDLMRDLASIARPLQPLQHDFTPAIESRLPPAWLRSAFAPEDEEPLPPFPTTLEELIEAHHELRTRVAKQEQDLRNLKDLVKDLYSRLS